jgi:HAE1 family hydrophobic/amphiphilic exporter-1
LTLLASLLTALTLIPMLTARFLHLSQEGNKIKGMAEKIYVQSGQWLNKLDSSYGNLLGWSLSHRKTVIIGGLLILIFSLLLLPLVGTRFMSDVDASMFRANIELPVGTRFEETGKVIKALEDIVTREVPEKIVMFAWWGSSEGRMRSVHGGGGTNEGMIGARLVPKEERKRLVKSIVDELRLLTENFPGAKIRYNTEDPMAGLLFAEGKPFVIEIYGHDLDEGMALANEIASQLQAIKGIVDIEISRKMGKPELQVRVDRDKASHLGLNVSDIGNTIQVFFSGKEATQYREKGKEYDIFVRLKEEDRQDIADLKNIFVTSPVGRQIRLTNVAQIIEKSGPVTIERKNQQRVIRVTANLSGRDLGSAVKEARQRLSEIRIPKDFFVDFGGEREEQQEAFGLLTIALLLGMILVYMVMAAQFESFRDPFIILFSIPFGMIGVIGVHLIFRQIFNINSFIGLIMLVGIVVNNAIVLISYINILRARGAGVREAVVEGGRSRLRPVLMTTLTTAFGLLPLAFSTGQGSEEWVTLSLTVIGGLLFSTLITLVFIPTLYSVFEEKVKKGELGRLIKAGIKNGINASRLGKIMRNNKGGGGV